MNPDFWAGRRVLLTGHTGFKGSWLALWLRQLGAHVTGYALEPATDPSLFQIAKVGEKVDSVIGDVRDLPVLRSVIKRVQPEVVIHMAAQALVRAAYVDPVGTYQTNVMGTVNVLSTAGLRSRVASSVPLVCGLSSSRTIGRSSGDVRRCSRSSLSTPRP